MTTYNMILTFVSAFIWALFGYLSRLPKDEAFKPEKLVTTFLAAIVVVFLSTMWNIPVEIGEEIFTIFLVQTSLIVFIERILKTIWRRWVGPLFGWVDE